MAILALSTAAETIIALKHEGQVHFRVNTERRRQAEFLVPMINELLKDVGIKFAAVKRVGVVTGPGSFTGLRVGIATAQGMAMGLNTECVGVDAFTFWRQSARHSGITAPLAIALNTLRDDVFVAAFDGVRSLLDPQVASPADVEKLLEGNPLSLVGDAYEQLPEYAFVPLTHTAMAEALIECVAAADAKTSPALPYYLRAPDVTVAA